MVSEREFESLVERCSGLPPSRDYSEDDYVTNLMLTVLDFQMQGRAVENALAGVSIQPLFDTLVLSAGQIEFEGQSEEAEREQTQTEVLPRLSQTAKGIRLHLRNTDRALRKTLTNLYRRANESLLEQGIHTLHLAIGFLEWYEVDHSSEPIRSPLLLVPVQLERQRGGVFVLEPTGEPPEMNIVLAEKLKRDLSVQLPEWHQDEEEQPDLASFLSEVRRATADLERSNIDESAMLDIFSFAKLVMYKDLERNTERALESALIRGICGEPTAGPSVDVPCGEELDRRLRYADCFHVLDADSSQREAIAAATKGESFMLVGPPGTGKSQTIANIIAFGQSQQDAICELFDERARVDEERYFDPPLTEDERRIAEIEGWILGIA
ncbi:MAG TPA: hypothetical protein DEP45_13815 [Armatimonadetes bacterium]|mgnify:CR=1 FL=1|nr:hypothetical protein [Armatimonadota bacterium]